MRGLSARAPLRLMVICIAFAVAACSPAKLLDASIPTDGYEQKSSLSYGPSDRHGLDVFIPEGEVRDAPVVVFFYGGSWRNGSKDTYRFIGEALVRSGRIVVIPDYRTYPEVAFPAFIEDGASALRWVWDNIAEFGGNREMITVMGHSAGAHIAAMLTFDERYLENVELPPTTIRALVGLAGPYAFDPLAYRSTRPIFSVAPDIDQTLPITFVEGETADILLLHGLEDRTVFPENSRNLAQRIRENGGHVTLKEYAGIGHVQMITTFAAPFRGRDGVYEETLRFLDSVDANQPLTQ